MGLSQPAKIAPSPTQSSQTDFGRNIAKPGPTGPNLAAKIGQEDQFWQLKAVPHCQKWSPIQMNQFSVRHAAINFHATICFIACMSLFLYGFYQLGTGR